MKGIDLFCASPASTAICVSMDQKSMVCHGGKAIDRQIPRVIDRRRSKQTNPYSQSPSKPRSSHQTSRRSSAKQNELISTPTGSSRYLLSDSAFFDISPLDFDPVPVTALVPVMPGKLQPVKKDQSAILKSSSSTTRSHDQVVVLRVSLHCKGCEAKVRKHISRMQGVRSFDIDFPAKKVTVMGDVTPLGVLASISKVKNAQLWS